MKLFYLVISVFTHFLLTASNTIGKSGKAYAMAAMMPFAMVPIDDVPLLSYALANKTVNASHNMSASNIEDVSMALMNGDPYTSAEQKQRDDQMVANAGSDWNDTKSLQNAGAETNWISESTIAKKDLYTSDEQRLRDQYQINETDWYSVGFEEVNGTSSCQLALHQDWITQHGYAVDGIVHMNLPEQGISGPFRVTAIKHILPQKNPESDPGDGYEWKPVTGLFKHRSDQVHNITFDSDEHRNETIGVTTTHPIYSATHHDWRLAGELEVGEQVLTYYGEATVTKTEKREGSGAVYNLEVKDLHNFLVGENGVVVHNNCKDWISKLADDWLKNGAHFNLTTSQGPIEITMVPNNIGGFNLKKWPPSASETKFLEGKGFIEEALNNKEFQKKLINRVEEAIKYASDRGSGKGAEFRFLLIALKNKYGI